MTSRGHLKLVHNNFEYTKNYVRDNITYWRCVRRRTCRAKAMTKNVGSKAMMKLYQFHSHGSNDAEMKTVDLKF